MNKPGPVKILFEANEDHTNRIEIIGERPAVKAGILALIQTIATAENIDIQELLAEFARVAEVSEKFKKMDPGGLLGLLERLAADEMDCDGDCENCEEAKTEMSEEGRRLYEKFMGGRKDESSRN